MTTFTLNRRTLLPAGTVALVPSACSHAALLKTENNALSAGDDTGRRSPQQRRTAPPGAATTATSADVAWPELPTSLQHQRLHRR